MLQRISFASTKYWLICTILLLVSVYCREFEFEHKVLFKTHREIIGLNELSDAQGREIVMAFRNGHANLWTDEGFFCQKAPKKLVLTPAKAELAGSCDSGSEIHDLSTSSDKDKFEFKKMDINLCYEHGKHKRYFFDYLIEDALAPKVSYAPRLDGHIQCQIYPQNMPVGATLQLSPHVSSETRNGQIVWMVDLDNQMLLAHVGTDKEDCLNRPIKYEVCGKKITCINSCCHGDWVFVGFDSGDIGIFTLIQDKERHFKIVLLKLLGPVCGCHCESPIPLKIQVCCEEKCKHRTRYNLVVLFKKCDGQTFLNYWTLEGNEREITSMGKHPKPGILAVDGIEDFRICCGKRPIVYLIKFHDNRRSLVAYHLLSKTDRDGSPLSKFLGKTILPCDWDVKAWTLAHVSSKDHKQDKRCDACCVLIAFHVPPPCTDCEPCPFRYIVKGFCLGSFEK